jgi:putative oxidoreductase
MYDDVGKLILRVTLGVLILFHGIGKVMHGIDPIQGMVQGAGLPAVLALAVYIGEVLAPILLLIGFYARTGAALITLNMLVAILLAHRQDILGVTPHGGYALELQAMFLFTAIALIFTGPGRFGINQR